MINFFLITSIVCVISLLLLTWIYIFQIRASLNKIINYADKRDEKVCLMIKDTSENFDAQIFEINQSLDEKINYGDDVVIENNEENILVKITKP